MTDVTRRGVHRWCGAALVTAALALAAPAAAVTRPVSALLMDARDGSILYAENAGIVRRPASLTKMMTLFLTFDALDAGTLHLDDSITISRYAASQKPSRIGFRPGATMTVDQAIRAIAVVSANDVAVALAEAVGGTEDRFARMMTAKARALGLEDTSFTNSTGLPGANLTTAQDIARLSLALLRDHPRRYAVFSTRSFTWAGRRVQNHNHLLGAYPGADGIKTGYTAEAGFALAASAKRGERRLIAVVIGERSIQLRDQRVARMLTQGFARAAGAAGAASLAAPAMGLPASGMPAPLPPPPIPPARAPSAPAPGRPTPAKPAIIPDSLEEWLGSKR